MEDLGRAITGGMMMVLLFLTFFLLIYAGFTSNDDGRRYPTSGTNDLALQTTHRASDSPALVTRNFK